MGKLRWLIGEWRRICDVFVENGLRNGQNGYIGLNIGTTLLFRDP